MKKEVAEAWVKALRSGDYKQTTSTLKSPAGYCCLGVLCDISGQGTWEPHGIYQVSASSGRSGTALPAEIVNWADMKSCSGDWEQAELNVPRPPGSGYTEPAEPAVCLMGLNDQLKWTFPQIADFIELNYKEL